MNRLTFLLQCFHCFLFPNSFSSIRSLLRSCLSVCPSCVTGYLWRTRQGKHTLPLLDTFFFFNYLTMKEDSFCCWALLSLYPSDHCLETTQKKSFMRRSSRRTTLLNHSIFFYHYQYKFLSTSFSLPILFIFQYKWQRHSFSHLAQDISCA